MKVGNKVYCINNYKEFEKGKFYVIGILSNETYINDGYIFIMYHNLIYKNGYGAAKKGHGFDLYEYRANRYFYKYFLSMDGYNKMIRKNKLEKINGIK